jgi:hypothetical protein
MTKCRQSQSNFDQSKVSVSCLGFCESSIFLSWLAASLPANSTRYILRYISLHEVYRMTFDAQCDVAAVVYGTDDDPDRLLIDFADDLRRSGLRPVGVIQIGRSCQSENPRFGVVMLPGGEVVRLAQESDAHGAGCRLDAGRLADLAKQLDTAIEGGADLVIINRFGRSEAEGGGLIDLVARALDADIPVLIAVPERRFSAWIRFSNGMNVRLACRRDALNRWWQSVAGTAMHRSPSVAACICELVK